MELSLVVMAAGLGSRFGGTKQLAAVGPQGEAIFDYTIHDARRAGFSKIIVIVRSDIEQDVRRHLLEHHGPALKPTFVCQDRDSLAPPRSKPWGTGHAILATRNVVTGPFAVVNADDFYGADAFNTLADALRVTPQPRGLDRYHLVVYRLDRTMSERGSVSRGVCAISAEGELQSIVEHLEIERDADGTITADHGTIRGDTPVSMNLWGFQPGLLNELETGFGEFVTTHAADSKAEYLLPDVIGAMIRRGDAVVDVHTTDATWLGVTYPGDLADARDQVTAMIEAGLYSSPLSH